MDEQTLSTLLGIAAVTGAGLMSAGLVYMKMNTKYQAAKKLLKDLVAAIDDDRLTTEEAQTHPGRERTYRLIFFLSSACPVIFPISRISQDRNL